MYYTRVLGIITGADEGTRTHDLCFTKALLYQLSYIGIRTRILYFTPRLNTKKDRV